MFEEYMLFLQMDVFDKLHIIISYANLWLLAERKTFVVFE